MLDKVDLDRADYRPGKMQSMRRSEDSHAHQTHPGKHLPHVLRVANT